MWKAETRRTYDRTGLRYPTDLTDAEWAILHPFLPPEAGCGRKRVGRCARSSTPCAMCCAAASPGG